MVRVRIIVPCYNEETRFDARAFEAYLASPAADGVGFVLVNDGSRDATLGVLQGLAARFPERVLVLDQQPNQGKAEAVRAGVNAALAEPTTQYVGYLDADLATPLAALADLTATLDNEPNIDFVVGARVALLGRDIDRKASRHYLGRLFATVASLVLGLPIYDTQCGAKLLRVTAVTATLFDKPFGSRWIFDVELIARFLTRGGDASRIYELPLRRWMDVGDSKVKPQDFLRAGGELAAIYRSYRLPHHRTSVLKWVAAPFVRYVGAGGLGTAMHYATLALLVEVLTVPASTATVVGALVGAAVNYVLNYHFTFASKASHRATLPKFAVVAAISAGLNGFGMHELTTRFGAHYLGAQLVCTVGVLLFGFVLNRVWTFRGVDAPEPALAASKLPPPRGGAGSSAESQG